MRLSFIPMRHDANYLNLEQGDAFIQFVMRIAVERLHRQLAGQIAFGAWALIKFHHPALCGRMSLAVNRVRRYLAQRTVYHFAAQCITSRRRGSGGMA